MESNEVLNETMGMNTKKAEVMDMKQDKRVEGDLIVTEDEVMKSEEGFNVDSLIARIDAKIIVHPF